MLVTGVHSEKTLSGNVGLTAFRVAVVQQQEFQETLERVSEKQSQVSEEVDRKAEEARERRAHERGGVDIVVDGDAGAASGTSEGDGGARGGSVDVEI